MTVPQMRKMLGIKKTESYWLVHRNLFQTDVINGQMMIDVESFEKWYANQVKHRKVDGPEPGAELTRMSYSFAEVAEMLMQAIEACENKWIKIAFHLCFTATLRLGEMLGLT